MDDRIIFYCRGRLVPGRSLSRSSFGMTMGYAGGAIKKIQNYVVHSNYVITPTIATHASFRRPFLSSSLRRLKGGGVPCYGRPDYLLLLGQAGTREIPQSFLLRDDDGLCGKGNK
jgi:hypothetical protein